MEVTGSPGDAAGSGALLKTGLKSIVSCVVVTVNLRYPLDFVIVEFKDHILVPIHSGTRSTTTRFTPVRCPRRIFPIVVGNPSLGQT